MSGRLYGGMVVRAGRFCEVGDHDVPAGRCDAARFHLERAARLAPEAYLYGSAGDLVEVVDNEYLGRSGDGTPRTSSGRLRGH